VEVARKDRRAATPDKLLVCLATKKLLRGFNGAIEANMSGPEKTE